MEHLLADGLLEALAALTLHKPRKWITVPL